MASNVREFFRQILMFDDEDFAPASVTKIPIPHEPTASQAGQGIIIIIIINFYSAIMPWLQLKPTPT